MSVRLPTTDQLLEIAKSFGMRLDPKDAESFRGLMAGSVASYNRLDELPEPKLQVKYPRGPGYRPGAGENRFNGGGRDRSDAGAGRRWHYRGKSRVRGFVFFRGKPHVRHRADPESA